MTRKQRHDIKRKLDVFNYAKNIGNIADSFSYTTSEEGILILTGH